MKKQIVNKIIGVVIGNIICSFAYNSFLMPNQLLVGGLSGISLILDYFFNFPVYWGILLFNIPIIFLGLKHCGKEKMFWTVVCIAFQAIFIPLFEPIFPTIAVDTILSAIFGGFINGIGCGLILKSGCTGGGTDVLGTICKEKYNVSIGTFSIAFNSVLMMVFLLFTPVQNVLYTIISIFIGSKVIDTVITGIVKNKSVTIISEKHEEIKEKILKDLHRGVTVYLGYGGYTEKSEKIVKCIISHYQVPALKELVKSIDKNAFIYITEIIEVNGNFSEKSITKKHSL